MPTNVVTFVLHGVEESIDLYDLDGVEWRDMKRATGLKQAEIVPAAIIDKDFEAVAALLWVLRRRSDPSVKYLDVLRSLSVAAIVGPDEEEPSSTVNGSVPNSATNGRSSLASTASGPGRPTS